MLNDNVSISGGNNRGLMLCCETPVRQVWTWVTAECFPSVSAFSVIPGVAQSLQRCWLFAFWLALPLEQMHIHPSLQTPGKMRHLRSWPNTTQPWGTTSTWLPDRGSSGSFGNCGGEIIAEGCVMLVCFDAQVWKERHSRFCVHRRADDGEHREHPQIKVHQVNPVFCAHMSILI